MFDVNFNFRGVNRVRNQLRACAAFHKDKADPIIEKHTKREAARMRGTAYPAELPNQKYQRTYQLQSHFRAQKVGNAHWRVINRVRNRYGAYAVWVIKKGMQNKKYHLGRWWTIEDKLQENAPMLTKNLAAELERILNNG